MSNRYEEWERRQRKYLKLLRDGRDTAFLGGYLAGFLLLISFSPAWGSFAVVWFLMSCMVGILNAAHVRRIIWLQDYLARS